MDGLTKSILLWRDWRSMGGREKNTMTVQFNITQTPGYGTYLDDAVGMPYGKTSDAITQWQEFFGYKPCLFKNGQVVGYLNPNDYTKFIDGRSADITSGNAGDVMIEFPRRGIKISKSGTTITVSMTKEDNVSGYSYNAHTNGTTSKNYFYIGAYLGYNNSGYLRSLSGKLPTYYTSLDTFRTCARRNGTGYVTLGFYQHMYIQCMYLLQFKGNLNSQNCVGYGYCYAQTQSPTNTGYSNTKGLIYGTNNEYPSYSTNNDHIKLFGIEDVWGNLFVVMDGLYVDKNYDIYTTTYASGFNDSSKYTNRGKSALSGLYMNTGVLSDVFGENTLGFFPYNVNGYDCSTYFCDYTVFPYNISSSGPTFLRIGGHYTNKNYAGMFKYYGNKYTEDDNSSEDVGQRLVYL